MFNIRMVNETQLLAEDRKNFLGLNMRATAILLMTLAVIVGIAPLFWVMTKIDLNTVLPSAGLLLVFVGGGVLVFFRALDPISGDVVYRFDKSRQVMSIEEKKWYGTFSQEIAFAHLKGFDVQKNPYYEVFMLLLSLEGGKVRKITQAPNPAFLQEHAKKIAEFVNK